MASSATAANMRQAATAFLRALDGEHRELAALSFDNDAARRWLEYRPERRPGACLAHLTIPARKAAHRLLATGLSEHAFAQAMVIAGLEEVLDLQEHGAMSRHSGGYFVTVFGDPAGNDVWSWRFEGHHLSVTMTVLGDQVSPAPVFLGAHPACVSYAGMPVSRPLGPEEDVARALIDALGPAGREVAIVADHAPYDIYSSTSARAEPRQPLGLASSALGPTARALLNQLAALYLDRLPPDVAGGEAARISGSELHFAWEGPLTRVTRHYYRVQGDDLLIEYDTTDDGNHAHTVLRRPSSDFGADILAAHHSSVDHPAR